MDVDFINYCLSGDINNVKLHILSNKPYDADEALFWAVSAQPPFDPLIDYLLTLNSDISNVLDYMKKRGVCNTKIIYLVKKINKYFDYGLTAATRVCNIDAMKYAIKMGAKNIDDCFSILAYKFNPTIPVIKECINFLFDCGITDYTPIFANELLNCIIDIKKINIDLLVEFIETHNGYLCPIIPDKDWRTFVEMGLPTKYLSIAYGHMPFLLKEILLRHKKIQETLDLILIKPLINKVKDYATL
jgi:hypothetical protein